ncbi:MAG TPA: hypothetical protein PLD46_04510 [Hyphomicrobium sp.]|nr:hypothetical protein [Hyphomicrobium sp.]
MAERTTAKAKRLDAPKGARKGLSKQAGVAAAVAAGADGALADENARLKADLAAAQERIADLELKQTEITNRIAWVIDSLHNLAD